MDRETFIKRMNKVYTISEWNKLLELLETDGDPIWGEKNFVIINNNTFTDHIPEIPDNLKTIII